jgi:hypothetical protein
MNDRSKPDGDNLPAKTKFTRHLISLGRIAQASLAALAIGAMTRAAPAADPAATPAIAGQSPIQPNNRRREGNVSPMSPVHTRFPS